MILLPPSGERLPSKRQAAAVAIQSRRARQRAASREVMQRRRAAQRVEAHVVTPHIRFTTIFSLVWFCSRVSSDPGIQPLTNNPPAPLHRRFWQLRTHS
eukprot:COSAG02_NODE_5077_length_4659_cov_29.565570_3_plen_99_part_00